MKEKIYTIPVNEAYDKDCECPMCLLESNLEKEALEYNLGAAMMEEDFRGYSDKTGYCNRHFGKFFEMPNKLPLALVLDTHMEEVRKELGKVIKKAPKDGAKSGLFGKKDGFAKELKDCLQNIYDGCVVCGKINSTMERYADVLLYMWANDDAFRQKFDKSKGLCVKHMLLLTDTAPKSIGSRANEFLGAMARKAGNEFDRIQEDIHRFTLKFDYRNKDMEWGSAKDAPIRTMEKLSGYIKDTDDEEL